MDCRVLVYTGDRPYAGTDANVRIIFHDINGAKSPEFKLDAFFRDDFERGDVNDFKVKIPKTTEFGTFKKIEFWRDTAGAFAFWYVDRISVEAGGEVFEFPVFRWIKPHHHYLIQHLDTALPQFDDHKQQRQMELDDKRKVYQLQVKIPGLPAQVSKIPQDEQFSTDYRWDMKKMKYQMALDTLIIRVTTGKWETLDSLRNIYVTTHLPEPESTKVWKEDSHFADMRVADINPVMIKLCTEIPDKLGVTEEMAAPFLEGLSLKEAIAEKRLFIADLEFVEGVPRASEELVVCAPIALFFETQEKQLMPIAIQLFQKEGPDNPVFLPSDPPMTWLLAKMWYNNADSAYHQAVTHLGFTHLIMEGISVITHRNLSQSHPIFKLLAPHFLYLIAINTLGLQKLISEGGWVDSVQGIGIKGTFHLIAKGISEWRMDVDGTFPEELRRRGLLDSNVLSYYPYRDDGLLIYNAIKNYVKRIVDLYYDSAEKLTDDHEIQSWAKELVMPKDQGGCGILGVPGEGQFTSNDQVVLVITSIISTCSLAHAAFNFPQYATYGFLPNCPLMLIGQPPTDKEVRTEADIVKALPNKKITMDSMLITKLLSNMGTKSLGDFDVNYVFDPKALEIIELFQKELEQVEQTIKERNKTRKKPYVWMQPSLLPNSISI